MLEDRNILIIVSDGVESYKTCELVDTLVQSRAKVKCILTNETKNYISKLTFTELSHHTTFIEADFQEPIEHDPLHIELGEWADLVVIMPVSSIILSNLATCSEDSVLTKVVSISSCPVLIVPSMSIEMKSNEKTRANINQLKEMERYHFVGLFGKTNGKNTPGTDEILIAIRSLLYTGGRRNLTDVQVLISTGCTREFLDSVRFIGNPATGRMGVALAQACIYRGARVTLVHGPMEPTLLGELMGIQCIPVVSSEEMHQAMHDHFPSANLVIMAAAVADVRPTTRFTEKLPKQSLPSTLALDSVPDILADLGKIKKMEQLLIGFAAQTGEILTPAVEKLQRKGLDAILANPIDQPNSGFGSDQNQAIFVDRLGHQEVIASCSKLEMAHRLLDFIAKLF
jgi:phosphopantothenoylcysteine decarboxylase/phosphopantothenate--cysteine ligase